MCLLSFSDEVLDPHQDTVFLWIHALPLEKLLFLSVHLFTCLIFFCVCVCFISADCKLRKTEVVSSKYLHNT